jgi:hypothetical protein
MLNFLDSDQKQEKLSIFEEEKKIDKKIKILAHSENSKSAKVFFYPFFLAAVCQNIPKLLEIFIKIR